MLDQSIGQNSIALGWRIGGAVAARIAIAYVILAGLAFYLQVSHQGLDQLWQPQRLSLANLIGNSTMAMVAAPILLVVPVGMAWLCGAVGGFMTGLLAPLLNNSTVARWWGMFCFFIPSLIFHNASTLRPTLIIGEHWLNSYWFWIGLPTIIAVIVGGWVGERLSG